MLYNVFGFPADRSFARIVLNVGQDEGFEKNIVPNLEKLGFVEKANKIKRCWFITYKRHWDYIKNLSNVRVSCRKIDRKYFGLK